MDNKDKSYIFKTIVIILLIIIIVLLLLNSCGAFGITNNGDPTGDFDVFEITLKGTCECPICEECKKCDDDSVSDKEKPTNPKKPTDSTDPEDDDEYEPNLDEERVVVYDNEEEWSPENTTSNIFRHASQEIVSNKIAPGSTNTYKFIVRNLNDFKVKYTISFVETNTKNINMKYRLKIGNTYLAGSDIQWVDEAALNRSFKSLNPKAMDTYYLDWKWFHNDEYDTPIGIDESSVYSLSINVEAEEE